MKNKTRLLVAIAGLLALLHATTLHAAPDDGVRSLQTSHATTGVVALHATPDEAAKKGCAKFEIKGEVAWFAFDEEGEVDTGQTVESYPRGTPAIAAGFEYSCVPKQMTIVANFSFGAADADPGDYAQVSTEKTKLRPSDKGDIFYAVFRVEEEGSALPGGAYLVEFYSGKQLLASSTVLIGDKSSKKPDDKGENDEVPYVTVQGKLRDQATRKPIKGGFVVALNPGITIEEWESKEYPTKDVYAYGESDRKGEWLLNNALERNIAYCLIAGAEGYYLLYDNEFTVTYEDPDPLVLTIDMEKIKEKKGD